MAKKLDLTNQKFGKLTVISEHPQRTKRGGVKWVCECECGRIKTILTSNLRCGRANSCGVCIRKGKGIKDISEQIFGRLTAIKYIYSKNNQAYWLCQCSCTDKTLCEKPSGELSRGNVKSCGCIQRERLQNQHGENGNNWNPDREYINLKNLMYSRYKALLRNLLIRINKKKCDNHLNTLGYSRESLMNNLNIKNIKDLKGKHIDHIFPVQAFIEYGITDPKIINALDNLQLLEAKENLSKNAKYNKEDFEKYLKSKGIEFESKLNSSCGV